MSGKESPTLRERISYAADDSRNVIPIEVYGLCTLLWPGVRLHVHGRQRVADVPEENQRGDDMLVLGGVHIIAERIRGGPEFGLEAEVGRRGVVVAILAFGHAFLRLGIWRR